MKKPNVLLILSDQHRQDCLSVYGNPDVISPNLEAIAKDGVVFDGHFCPYPICTPSRYSLLTGKYPSFHLGANNDATLPNGIETFPKVLRREGYKTAAVGKMHFAPTYLDVGFDKMLLSEQCGPGRFCDDYHRYLKNLGLLDVIDLYDQRGEYRQNAPAEYWENFGALCSDLPLEHHSTTYITNQALAQVDQFNPDGGNLLMLGYIKPHHPFDPPEPYAGMYDPDTLSLLDGYTPTVAEVDKRVRGFFDFSTLTEKDLRRVMAHYYGSITQIDDGVGQILQRLKDRGMYDDSLIIFTSDHGDYMGYRHLITKCNHMYDPIMRIPLIIKYPASWNKTGVDRGLSTNIDIAKTILTVCGVEHAPTMRGLDLTRGAEREIVVGEYSMRGLNEYMIRSKTHKLLLYADGAPRLFDLAADPQETNDVAGDPAYADVLRDLKDKLIEEFILKRQNTRHQDVHAPVVNGKTHDEMTRARLDMADYMATTSAVKPARVLYG